MKCRRQNRTAEKRDGVTKVCRSLRGCWVTHAEENRGFGVKKQLEKSMRNIKQKELKNLFPFLEQQSYCFSF